MIPHILIKTSGNKAKIFVDGEELKGVRRVKFEKTGLGTPILNIDLIATDMTIDSYLIPELPEVFRGFYRPIEEPTE